MRTKWERRCRGSTLFVAVVALGGNSGYSASRPGGSNIDDVQSHAAARDLASAVRRQIQARLPGAEESIRVENRNGRIVLRGTVDILPKKEIAAEAAQSVPGVQEVANELRVTAERRDDRELERNVRWTLRADPATSALGIEVSVRDGVVTLGGAVDTLPQKRITEWVVSGLIGVAEVKNEIRVAPERRNDREIHDELLQHYATSPLFNDDRVDVQVDDGVVALSGHVDSALEKNWARDDAWVRGVRQVDGSRLAVKPTPALSGAAPAERPVLTDEDIRQTIVKAFAFDPRVSTVNPEVRVERGVVRLGGTVTNRRAKEAAVQIARNTGGVREVIDRLQVKSDQPRPDAEILREVREALRTSAALARNEVEVSVKDSRVALSGTVDSYYEKWVAGNLAERTAGVDEVDNKLAVEGAAATVESAYYFFPSGSAYTPWTYSLTAPREPKSDPELTADVRHELVWSPLTDAEDIRVTTQGGVVILRGDVDSWAERNAAIDNAYQAGAREVVDRLRVASRR